MSAPGWIVRLNSWVTVEVPLDYPWWKLGPNLTITLNEAALAGKGKP